MADMTTTRLFSVEEYHCMSDQGILSPEERTELIDGEIILMAAKRPPHSAITKRTADYLRELLAGLADVRVQEPIHLNSHSEPEPDIAVVAINQRDYVDHHPTPSEIFLLIEIAETTLSHDCKRKAAAYAKAKIADYWVIDVKNEQVFVFRALGAKTYQQETVLIKGENLVAIAFPEILISVTRFFP